ncbi:MAG: CoA pyrophosphatase [Bacteroidota bacterium]
MISKPFPDQISFLRNRLQRGLPGLEAHLNMAPAARAAPDSISIKGKPCRQAAVLALLFPLENATGILLTKRKETLSKHAGQISFPGGKQEADESLPETALRETEEEIGLPPHDIDMLGALSPLYIDVSNFCVFPFLGALHQMPTALVPQDTEVERILKVPLHNLADPAIQKEEIWTLRGQQMTIPYYAYEQETIWGATAMMLAELLHLFTIR